MPRLGVNIDHVATLRQARQAREARRARRISPFKHIRPEDAERVMQLSPDTAGRKLDLNDGTERSSPQRSAFLIASKVSMAA